MMIKLMMTTDDNDDDDVDDADAVFVDMMMTIIRW